MKEIIPFRKDIVFKTNIASITSMSLEHDEKILDGEISGDFIIYGDYKIHSDTTEKEMFRYKLPFTAIIPDNINKDSIVVDIVDFKYEQVDEDVLRVDISFSFEGDLTEENINEEEIITRKYEEELDEFLDKIDDIKKDDDLEKEILIEDNNDREDILPDTNNYVEEVKTQEIIVSDSNTLKEEVKEEYVTYHIHIVKEQESIENIIRDYNISLDYIKEYNDITNIKVGDKIIIPEYLDE